MVSRPPSAALIRWFAGVLCGLVCLRARAITITELHYDPPGENAGLEFIEVHNDAPTAQDLSGWTFTEGVDFTFPQGTLIGGRGYLVVVGNEATFQAAYPSVTPVGVFSGRLDSNGETLVLAERGGGEMVRVRYSYRGKWPTVPAGTGHTLSLRATHLDPGEPESWTASALPGGTPGRLNATSTMGVTELIPAGTTWHYRKGTEPFSDPAQAWLDPAFSPVAGWLFGPAAFGYGDGDDTTLLADMQGGFLSVAVRKTFTLSQVGIDSLESLVLAIDYDDGFIAYLNGVEVARAGLAGDPGVPVPIDAVAAGREAGFVQEFILPRSALRAGSNALCIQGHNSALDSSDFTLSPRLLGRRAGSAGGIGAVVSFNELLGRGPGPRWVELHNASATPVDLSGFFVSDSAADLARHALPAGSVLSPGGFLVVPEAGSGLDLGALEVRLFLTRPDQAAVLAGAVFSNATASGSGISLEGVSEARFPDGAGEICRARTPTPGAPNTIDASRDVVINELFYHAPAGHAQGEFIELFNRGDSPVDLTGWTFTRGISYAFPALSLPPGGYLVVAADPAGLAAAHGIAGVLGPWTGSLSNAGENVRLADRLDNTVDEVRYHDGGRWPRWADGGGSSLELLDPRQDNDLPSAWEASDESARAPWAYYTYTDDYNPEANSELHFLLLEAGAARLDDVSLKRSGDDTEHVPNGGFEADTTPWLLQGTHAGSRRTASDAHGGTACLEIVASSAGDPGVNKIDTDTVPAMVAGTYTVSFWARWLRGSPRLLSRADSRRSANLSRSHELQLPPALGTPGRENSVRVGLRALEPTGNLGPVIGEVRQEPVTPGPTHFVHIEARAADADGVAALTLSYRLGGRGDGIFASLPMFDDGLHGDGGAADGQFAGALPPQALGSRVLYYLEGRDAAGAVRRFPVEAPSRTLLYVVETPGFPSVHRLSLNFDADTEAELTTRLLHSDALLDGSLTFEDREVYHNIGLRYRGSPWGRPGEPKNFRLRFNEDQLFVRGLRAVNLSRSGWALNEGTAYHLVGHAAAPSSPSPAADYLHARVNRNGALHGQMAVIETIDSRYIERRFPADAGGLILKVAARPYLGDDGVMDGVDGTTLAYLGQEGAAPFERYRWFFVPGSRQDEDRWNELNALCETLDVSRTPVTQMEAAIESILDVEQFLRVEAARTLQDDWDTIGIGGGHNAYLYHAPLEGRWKLLAWDMDNTFGNAQAKLFPEGADAQVTRLVQRPRFRRVYLRIVDELLRRAWDPEYLRPYFQQMQNVTGLNPTGLLSFLSTRRPLVEEIVPRVELKLTAVGALTLPPDWQGVHYSARSAERTRGLAPIEVTSIVVLRDGEALDLPVTWTISGWSIEVPIDAGEHSFEYLAFDAEGGLTGSLGFRVISTASWNPPVVTAVDPVRGPTAGGTTVRLQGRELHPGARGFFGTAESPRVDVVSTSEVLAVTPPSAAGAVTIRVRNADLRSYEVDLGFEYVAGPRFVRGDATGDASVDLADAVRILLHLFTGATLACRDAADADDDGQLAIADAVRLLNFLYRGGQAPSAPHPAPGEDSALPADALDCAAGR